VILRQFLVIAALLFVSGTGQPQSAEVGEVVLYPHAERQSGPWGYIDKTGRIVIPLQFEAAEPFSEGRAAVALHNKHGFSKTYGFIDGSGRLVIPAQFKTVQPFQSGLAAVLVPPLGWGYIDSAGAILVPPSYRSARSFNEGRAIVATADIMGRNWKVGAINLAGEIAVPLDFQELSDFSEGVAAARREGKFGFIDKDGKVTVGFQFQRAFPFRSGKARVFRGPDGRSGLIDRTGTLLAPFDYDMVYDFNDGFAVVRKAHKFGLIDAEGKIVIPLRFAEIGRPSDSHLAISKSASFSEGLLPATLARNTKFGYVDRDNNLAIEPQFARAYEFGEGRAIVQTWAADSFGVQGVGGLFSGLIDRSGRFVVAPIFDWIRRQPGGLLQVKFGDRLGYIDADGRPLTFSSNEIDAYVERKKAELEQSIVARKPERLDPGPPPPRDRAVFAKAGDTEYLLRLPESLCPLDDKRPSDRRFIDEYWARAENAEGLEKMERSMPRGGGATLRSTIIWFKSVSRFVLPCEVLEKLRSGGDGQAVRTYVIAAGMQKDSYSPSFGAGITFGSAFLCGMFPGDVFKLPDEKAKDPSGVVTAAFKAFETGQVVKLRTMERNLPACYTAWVTPPQKDGGSPGLLATGKLNSFAFLMLGDWAVQVVTDNVPASSADDFYREFERDRALVLGIAEANTRK
jgi:WG containing repeat